MSKKSNSISKSDRELINELEQKSKELDKRAEEVIENNKRILLFL